MIAFTGRPCLIRPDPSIRRVWNADLHLAVLASGIERSSVHKDGIMTYTYFKLSSSVVPTPKPGLSLRDRLAPIFAQSFIHAPDSQETNPSVHAPLLACLGGPVRRMIARDLASTTHARVSPVGMTGRSWSW